MYIYIFIIIYNTYTQMGNNWIWSSLRVSTIYSAWGFRLEYPRCRNLLPVWPSTSPLDTPGLLWFCLGSIQVSTFRVKATLPFYPFPNWLKDVWRCWSEIRQGLREAFHLFVKKKGQRSRFKGAPVPQDAHGALKIALLDTMGMVFSCDATMLIPADCPIFL